VACAGGRGGRRAGARGPRRVMAGVPGLARNFRFLDSRISAPNSKSSLGLAKVQSKGSSAERADYDRSIKSLKGSDQASGDDALYENPSVTAAKSDKSKGWESEAGLPQASNQSNANSPSDLLDELLSTPDPTAKPFDTPVANTPVANTPVVNTWFPGGDTPTDVPTWTGSNARVADAPSSGDTPWNGFMAGPSDNRDLASELPAAAVIINPEPSTWALMIAGLASLAVVARRRNRVR